MIQDVLNNFAADLYKVNLQNQKFLARHDARVNNRVHLPSAQQARAICRIWGASKQAERARASEQML